MTEDQQQLTESLILTVYITEKGDLDLIKEVICTVHCEILKIEPYKYGGHDVTLLIESPTQLFLLGKYVGFQRDTILDKPTNNKI